MASSAASQPIDVLCIATQTKDVDMKPWKAQRRPVGDFDVLIDMKYCGVCHSDLHFVKGDLTALVKPLYPFCPGHELSGIAVVVGPKVTKFKVGDHVGVGCSESPRRCATPFSACSSTRRVSPWGVVFIEVEALLK